MPLPGTKLVIRNKAYIAPQIPDRKRTKQV